MKSGTIIVLCLLFVIAMSCMQSEGMTSSKRMLTPSKWAGGQGKLIERTTQGPFYETYDVQCAGDRAVGNTIVQAVPTDMYSTRNMAKKFGYQFRYMNDDETRGVYPDPYSAMKAYCDNPNRVINAMPSY
jgi:hypothetical protein